MIRQAKRRRWFAVGLASVLQFLSYTLFIFGFAVASGDETVFAGGLVGIAIGLVPAVFVAAAALSQHEHTIRASLLATLLWFVVALPLALIDIPAALVAGFGAGGVVAIRAWGPRVITYRAAAVGFCVLYMLVVQLFAPAAAIMVGAIVPLVAVVVADVVREHELAGTA